MPRFFVFGTVKLLSIGDDHRINAAYAFCLEERPDRMYWSRGTNMYPAAVIREACIRIFEAVSLFDSPPEIEVITSNYSLPDLAGYALNRNTARQEARRKKGLPPKDPADYQEQRWLRFAQLYNALKVKSGHVNNHPNKRLFLSVKREAQKQYWRNDLNNKRDLMFTQRDDFDLFDDMSKIY